MKIQESSRHHPKAVWFSQQ